MFSAVFVFPNEQSRRLVARIIRETTGIRPAMVRNSESADRLIFDPAPARNILNTSSVACLERLGHPCAAISLAVNDRSSAAELAAVIARESGCNAEVIYDAVPEFPVGFVVFVRLSWLDGRFVLLFAPKDPPQEEVQKIPPAVPPSVPRDLF